MLGSKHVSDEALLKANDTIRKMFAYRHDILKAMIADGARLVVLGRKEKTERSAGVQGDEDDARLRRRALSRLHAEAEADGRSRGECPGPGERSVRGQVHGGEPLRQGTLSGDRHSAGRSQVQRLSSSTSCASSGWTSSSTRSCKSSTTRRSPRDLWKGTPAARTRGEYWAAGVEAYFDAAGPGFPPSDADRPITTREALKAYDPELYALVDETMAYKEHQDWRFSR